MTTKFKVGDTIYNGYTRFGVYGINIDTHEYILFKIHEDGTDGPTFSEYFNHTEYNCHLDYAYTAAKQFDSDLKELIK
jgi:hypothetical protein